MADLFQTGDHVLHSGARSPYKIDCDALSDASIQTLAMMIRDLVGPFVSVEGIPRGGLRLAAALEPLCITERMGVPWRNLHLIVDDVLTSGGSMEEARAKHMGQGPAGRPGIIGAVLFARGPLPYWIKAVFPMPQELWVIKEEGH